MTLSTRCSVCSAPHARRWDARELRFGTQAEFAYGECSACGALELLNPPSDLAPYYPDDYYSFVSVVRPRWKHALRTARNRLVLGKTGLLARGLARVKPHPATPWLMRTGLSRNARILDVGCGSGELLRDLADAGFTSLLGVDRYVHHSVDDPAGFRVIRGSIDDIRGAFDLVMFHHSLEHIVEQRRTLAAAAALLAPDGWCVVRLPVVPSEAWEHYREHWVQLEPPRHIILHSVESLRLLSAEAGLTLCDVVYDSGAFQFAGSELYRRGAPFDDTARAFSRRDLRRFEARARALNRAKRGDQAVFYFTPMDARSSQR